MQAQQPSTKRQRKPAERPEQTQPTEKWLDKLIDEILVSTSLVQRSGTGSNTARGIPLAREPELNRKEPPIEGPDIAALRVPDWLSKKQPARNAE
jgi:hypothetical protein